MKSSSKSELVSQFVISFFLVLTGLWVPFVHLYFLNSVNFTLPFSVHLPLLGLLSAGIFGIGLSLQVFAPARIRTGVSFFLLSVGIFFWAESTLFIGNFGFLQGGDMRWGDNQYLLYLEILLVGFLGLLAFKLRRQLIQQAKLVLLFLVISSAANIYPAFQIHISRTKIPTRHTFTQEGVLKLSPEKNVLIYIIDTFQSDVFAEIITENPGWKNVLNGFTYFPNAISAFPKTYASIPNILTGKAFDNSQPFPLFMRDAYLGNSAPKVLKDNGFDVRYRSFTWQPYLADSQVADNLTNIKSAKGRQWMQRHEFNKLSNLSLFRLSPFLFKPWVYNDNEFRLKEAPLVNDSKHSMEQLTKTDGVYSSGNKVADLKFHDELMAFLSVDSHKPSFRVFHFAGVHEPLSLDQDLNFIGKQPNLRPPFKSQAKGMLKMLELEFQRLRDIGAYDNSLIFIVGDHGCGEHREVDFRGEVALKLGIETDLTIPDNYVGDTIIRGAVPIILVKPMGSTESMDMLTSPVELGDIPNTIFHEMDLGEKASGPSVFDIPESSDRKRYHRHYRFAGWGQDFIVPLTEYEISGFSWAPKSWALTGRDLNKMAVETIDGQLIILGKDGNLDSFTHEGWLDPEAQGRFFAGGKGSISIPMTGYEGPKWIGIRTRPYRASKTAVPLTLSVNNQPVATWDFSSKTPEYIKTTIPARVLEAKGDLKLSLNVGDPDNKGPFIIEIRILDVPDFHSYKTGDNISFVAKGNSTDFTREGFYKSEDWGTWTVGNPARVCLTLDKVPTEDLEIEMKLRPAIFPKSPPLKADLTANGTLIKQMTFSKKGWHTLNIRLPKELITESRELDLLLTIHNPRSVKEFTKKGDIRKLGLGFSYLKIQPAGKAKLDANSPLDRNLIFERTYTQKIIGMYPIEKWDGKSVAWTNGSANIQIPIPQGSIPTAIEISCEAGSPGNGGIVVYANNSLVAAPAIEAYPWSGIVNLDNVPINEELSLVISSASHIPAQATPGHGDKRILGTALSVVKLQNSPRPTSPSSGSTTLLAEPYFQDLTPNNEDNSPWTGVFTTESWREGPTTWTKEEATCMATWSRPGKPRYLLLDMASVAPAGTHLSIKINNTQVVLDKLFNAPGPQIIDVSNIPSAQVMEIVLSNTTFIPSECRSESTDNRALGIALRQVLLIE